MDEDKEKTQEDATEPKRKAPRCKKDAKEKPVKKAHRDVIVVCKGVHIVYLED